MERENIEYNSTITIKDDTKHVCISANDQNDDNVKSLIVRELDKLVKREIKSIRIVGIVSSDFLNMFDLEEPDDFNGWQCDWWNHMYHNGQKIEILGGAFYGTIDLSIPEEENDENYD